MAHLREERGSLLVEALVAAVLLVILAMGFLAAIDSTSKISGSLKSRAAAASLAQDDMERLRAMKVADLANLSQTRTQAEAGITYTIKSTAVWVDDTTGAATCPSGATKSDYLKINSSVTWPAMGVAKPVAETSLVAVPLGTFGGGNGGLIARVQGRDGTGLQGINVALSGTSTSSGVTDADGCVYWPGLTAGGYYLDLNQPGYVDQSGTAAVHQSASVVGSSTNVVSFAYDRAATLSVNFDTVVSGVTKVAKGSAFMVAHSQMPSPGTRTFTTGTATTTMSSGATLFPFSSQYAVWGGSCANADPRLPLYGATTPLAQMNPGSSASVTVRMPAVNLRVTRGGTPYVSAHVILTPTTAGCGAAFSPGPVDATGALSSPGQPYGDYDVCVDDGSRRAIGSVQNRNALGSTLLNLAIPTSGATPGACT